MLGLSFNNVANILYSIVITMTISIFIIAYKYRFLDNRILHHELRLVIVALLVFFQKIYLNEVAMIKIVIISEIVYLLITMIGDFIPYHSKLQKKYTLLGIFIAICFLLVLLFTEIKGLIYDYSIGTLVLAYLAITTTYILLKHFRKASLEWITPHFYNIAASLIILISLSTEGIFIFAILKGLCYAQLLKQVWLQITLYNDSLLSEAKQIERDFKDAVRKEVNEKLFYMKLSKEKMAKVAKIDNLTGALNKKAIIDMIEKLFLDKRTHVFSILMFDIDKFKEINDTLGHIVGDKCLKNLAMIARDSIRGNDELGRYGGDEFIIVLPGADIRTATTVAERFRKSIEKTDVPHFTISIGIANYPEDGETTKDLIKQADGGLYLSKSKGRNKTSYMNKKGESNK